MSDTFDEPYARLAEGVAALREGPGWKQWLAIANAMPNYSLNNQILLMMQMPEAQMVCGYRKWAEFGRNVKKGEKALRVLAPSTRKIDQENPTTGEAEKQTVITGFRMVPVFDVSQTEGDPLPTPPRPVLLEGQAPEGLWEHLAAQVQTAGFTLARVPQTDLPIPTANGVTAFLSREVLVRNDVSDAQAVKTLAHELGHVRLHDPTDASNLVQCRGTAEVEAESVAYLVSEHFGLDSSGYTFAYVASWASGLEDESLVEVAGRVRSTVKAIIDGSAATAEPPVTEPGLVVSLPEWEPVAFSSRPPATASPFPVTAGLSL
ncbi:MAG: ArdC family protein [Gammaproteobacteria bacterium]|nr:ArdC family protein [Gammaproteobacteria bacterium]